MTQTELLAFLRAQSWAVEASVAATGAPQAAVIGVAVTDRCELVFDTLSSSRKHANLVRDPRTAFVVGWDHARTVQYEGLADQPTGAELVALQAVYFARYPDGPARLAWPDITYWRVRPTWIRYRDFNVDPPILVEWDQASIRGWGEP